MQKIFERLPSPKEGYWMVKVPVNYPTGRPYDSEHRAIWWYYEGCLPPRGWHIHHINGDCTDNRIENLEAVHASEHAKKPGHVADKDPAGYVQLTCKQCQKEFSKLGSSYEYWVSVGQKDFFCDKPCQVTYQNQFKKGKKNNYPKNHKQAVAPTLMLNCHACGIEFKILERKDRERINKGVKKFSCSRSCVNKLSLA